MSEAYLLLFDKYSVSSLLVDEYVLGSVGYFLPTYLTRYMYLIFVFLLINMRYPILSYPSNSFHTKPTESSSPVIGKLRTSTNPSRGGGICCCYYYHGLDGHLMKRSVYWNSHVLHFLH